MTRALGLYLLLSAALAVAPALAGANTPDPIWTDARLPGNDLGGGLVSEVVPGTGFTAEVVVTHCGSGRRIVLQVGWTGADLLDGQLHPLSRTRDAADRIVRDAVATPTVLTLDDLARRLATLGQVTRASLDPRPRADRGAACAARYPHGAP